MPKQYLYQKMIKSTDPSPELIGNHADAQRAFENRGLSNEMILMKVKDAILMEKASKYLTNQRSEETMKKDFEKLLTTKLISKPYYL